MGQKNPAFGGRGFQIRIYKSSPFAKSCAPVRITAVQLLQVWVRR